MGAAWVALILSSLGFSALFSACKPTERGYKNAYDAAVNKRAEAVREQMLPATGLLSDDGPQMRVVDGDTIFVMRDRIYRPSDRGAVKGWSVAVGQFKMHTTAEAGAERLKEEGYPGAMAARASQERWYTIVANVSTLDSARVAATEFRRSRPDYPFVGLPGSPVIIGIP